MRRSPPQYRPLPIVLNEEAQRDFEEDFEYLFNEAGYGVATRYIAAVERTATLIATFPGIGKRCPFDEPPLSTLRRTPLYGRFSSRLLFYFVADDTVHIARILHGKQNWISLLRQTDLRWHSTPI